MVAPPEYLTDQDATGGEVVISVEKSKGLMIDVHISRMATAKIAERRRLFDLFALVKDRIIKKVDKGDVSWFGPSSPDDSKVQSTALNHPSGALSLSALLQPLSLTCDMIPQSTVELVDEAVSLWSKMLQAELMVQTNVLHEVGRLQRDGSQHATKITEVVSNMNEVFSLVVDSVTEGAGNTAEKLQIRTLESWLATAEQAAKESAEKVKSLQHAQRDAEQLLQELTHEQQRANTAQAQLAEMQRQAAGTQKGAEAQLDELKNQLEAVKTTLQESMRKHEKDIFEARRHSQTSVADAWASLNELRAEFEDKRENGKEQLSQARLESKELRRQFQAHEEEKNLAIKKVEDLHRQLEKARKGLAEVEKLKRDVECQKGETARVREQLVEAKEALCKADLKAKLQEKSREEETLVLRSTLSDERAHKETIVRQFAEDRRELESSKAKFRKILEEKEMIMQRDFDGKLLEAHQALETLRREFEASKLATSDGIAQAQRALDDAVRRNLTEKSDCETLTVELERKSAELLGNAKELEVSKREAATMREELNALCQRESDLREEMLKLVKQLEEQMQNAEVAAEVAQATKLRAQGDVDETKTKLTAMGQALVALRVELDESKARSRDGLSASQQAANALVAQLAKESDRARLAEERVEGLQRAAGQLEQELSASKTCATAVAEDLQEESNKVASLENERQALQSRTAVLSRQVEEMEASMKVTAGETSRLENELTSAQKQLASSQLDNSKLLAEGKELARSLASEKERNNELSQGTRQLKADLAECLGKLQEAKSEGEQLAKDVDKARMSEKRADELERVTKELLIERDTTKRAVEESEAKVQELEEELKEVRASTEARVADLQREAAIYKRELGKERSEEDGAKFQIRRLKLRVAEVSSLKTEAENRLQSVLSSILQVAEELEAVHREFKLCQIRSLEGLSHLAAASVEIQQQYQKHLSSLKEFLVSTPDGVLCIALAFSCTFDVFRWP